MPFLHAGAGVLKITLTHGDEAVDAAKAAKQLSFPTGHAAEECAQNLLGGTRQVTFKTSHGVRYVDVLKDGIAHEIKVGKVKWSEFYRNQILKDAELIKAGDITGAHWHFYPSEVTGKVGADLRILKMLEQNNIPYTIHQ